MDQPPETAPTPKPRSMALPLHNVFFNGVEVRAGWRLLIFAAILLVTPDRAFFFDDGALRGAEPHAARPQPKKLPARNQVGELPPQRFIRDDGLSFVFLLGASAFMAIIERRPLRYFGLPFKQAFRGRFWLGCLWGFSGISALLLMQRAVHGFYFGSAAIRGTVVIRFALLWGVAFLMVAFFEEYLLRGYAQFTLTLGLGFWPAAVLLSVFFAFLHRHNPGETVLGLFQIVLIALFFCYTLWRTGSLWFAVGFHAAWDWSQSFLYGTPDSGVLAQGHLLHPTIAGPTWLNGGTVGPEGSVITAPLVALLFVLFYYAFPDPAPYPDPAALKPADPAWMQPKTLL